MTWAIAKILIAGSLISFASWLAGSRPALAGFIIALPISSMIALALTYGEFRDPAKASAFARSIFASVPLSLVFFLPFFLAERLRWPFPLLYLSGIALLGLAYLVFTKIAS